MFSLESGFVAVGRAVASEAVQIQPSWFILDVIFTLTANKEKETRKVHLKMVAP